MSETDIFEQVAAVNPILERDLEGPRAGSAALIRNAVSRPAHHAGGGRPMRRVLSVGATAVGVAGIAVLLVAALPRGGDGVGNGPSGVTSSSGTQGTPILPIELPLLDRGPLTTDRLRLGELHGRWIVLALVASWCGPCQGTHLRDLRAFARDAAPDVLTVVVATNDLPQDARAALASRHGYYPLASDPRGQVLKALGGTGLPTTVIISPDGRLVDAVHGPGLQKVREQLVRLRAAQPSREGAPTGDAPVAFPGSPTTPTGADTIDIFTPIGTAHLPARPGWTAADYTLLAAANGIAVVSTTKDEGAANGGVCIFAVPLNPGLAAGGGCDKRDALARKGSVLGLASGDGRTFHIAILPAGASGMTTANGEPAIVQNGVAFAVASKGTDVVFRNGSWTSTSLDAAP